MISFSRAIQHPFDDNEWFKKLGAGALINLVPILNFANAGYAVAHLRNVARGQDTPLPDWKNLSDFFVSGLKQFVVNLVYSSPLLLLVCALYGAIFAIAIANSGGRSWDRAMNRAMEQNAPVFICLACLITLVSLVYTVLMPAVTIQFARTDTISGGLRFGQALGIIRQRSSDYLKAILVPFAIIFGIGIVFGIAITLLLNIPDIGIILYSICYCSFLLLVLVGSSYFTTVFAHLYGQIARGLDGFGAEGFFQPTSPAAPTPPLGS